MREYLLVMLVAATATYLLTVVAREFAIRTGAVAPVRDRDVHAEPIPYLGGLAMYGGLVIAFLVARELPFLSTNGSFVFDDATGVLVAGGIVCVVGTLDDIFDLDAMTKFGGQLVAVGVLVYSGVQFKWIPMPDGTLFSLDPAQGVILTVLVVVGTVNAVNFVDGLDGLAGGVVAIGAIAFFGFSYQLANINNISLANSSALLSVALAGACAGFLAHNIHPARLFMGDSGSMLIGLVLSASALTLTTTFNGTEFSEGAGEPASLLPTLLPPLLPLLILVVPLLDLVLAVARRTRQGVSISTPDKLHLHHRLLVLGHSQMRAVLIMWLWTGLFAFGTVFASLYSGPRVLIATSVMLVVTLALTFLVPLVHKPGEPAPEPVPDLVPEP